jgi:hypothetical protein
MSRSAVPHPPSEDRCRSGKSALPIPIGGRHRQPTSVWGLFCYLLLAPSPPGLRSSTSGSTGFSPSSSAVAPGSSSRRRRGNAQPRSAQGATLRSMFPPGMLKRKRIRRPWAEAGSLAAGGLRQRALHRGLERSLRQYCAPDRACKGGATVGGGRLKNLVTLDLVRSTGPYSALSCAHVPAQRRGCSLAAREPAPTPRPIRWMLEGAWTIPRHRS